MIEIKEVVAKSVVITLSEPAAKQLLAMLDSVYKKPVELDMLVAELYDIGYEPEGEVFVDEDRDPCWRSN